jgi:hypothetical protein
MPKTCNGCSTETKIPATVPYQVLKDFKETAKANSLKWFIICLVLIVLLVGSNIGWLIYENSFEDIVVTQENEDGYNNYIGEDGNITN